MSIDFAWPNTLTWRALRIKPIRYTGLNMEFDYIKIIVTITLAVIGWVVGHYFTNKRIIASKQRDIITEHLISSYRILLNDISQREPTEEWAKKIEELISDLQLFGTQSQIEIVKNIMDGFSKNKDVDLGPLLDDLRNDLRKRLNLGLVSGNVMWFRACQLIT